MLDVDAHWRHLANTIEPSTCGCDAALLLNYLDHLFISTTDFVSMFGCVVMLTNH